MFCHYCCATTASKCRETQSIAINQSIVRIFTEIQKIVILRASSTCIVFHKTLCYSELIFATNLLPFFLSQLVLNYLPKFIYSSELFRIGFVCLFASYLTKKKMLRFSSQILRQQTSLVAFNASR